MNCTTLKSAGLVACACLLLPAALASASAGDWQVTKVTNTDWDFSLQLLDQSGGRAIWYSTEAEYDIAMYDGSSIVPLSQNADIGEAHVSTNYAAWREGADGSDLFVYDGSSTTCLAGNVDGDFCMSDDLIVWPGMAEDGNRYVHVYDIASGQTTVLPHRGGTVDVDGMNVAYLGSDGHDSEVFYYNAATAALTQLTDNLGIDSAPMIYGDTVAWGNKIWRDGQIDYVDIPDCIGAHAKDIGPSGVLFSTLPIGSSNGRREVFLYDGETAECVTNGTYNMGGDILFAGDDVVWVNADADGDQILLYDGEEIVSLAQMDCIVAYLAASEECVAWSGDTMDYLNIYLATRIPEPGVLTLLVAGCAVLIRRRRRG